MKIAIITPVFKQTQYLPRFLDSVLWQMQPGDQLRLSCEREEYQSIESLLISRNISSDKNVFLCARQAGQANSAGGRIDAIQRIPLSESDWLKFLDADDVLAPFALDAFRMEAIPDTVHCVAGAQIKVVDGRMTGFGITDWKLIERVNPCLPSMTFVRRAAYDAVGGFDERIGFEEDWDLWLRLRKEFGMGCFARVNWTACYYWINQADRALKKPCHEVDGMNVREYFAKTYGITPHR